MLERKLKFLQHVLDAEVQSICGSVYVAMCDNLTALCLVKECRELEEMCGVSVSESIIKRNLTWSKELREEIRKLDYVQMMECCK